MRRSAGAERLRRRLAGSALAVFLSVGAPVFTSGCCEDALGCGPTFLAAGEISFPETADVIEVDVCLAAECGTLVADVRSDPYPGVPLRAKEGSVPPLAGIVWTDAIDSPRRNISLETHEVFESGEEVAFQLRVSDPATGFDYTSVVQRATFVEGDCGDDDEESSKGCVWARVNF